MIPTIRKLAWPHHKRFAFLEEKDAMDKLCAGPPGTGVLATSRDGKIEARLCVASDCMAWRWGDALEDAGHPMELVYPHADQVKAHGLDQYSEPYPSVNAFRPEGDGWHIVAAHGDPKFLRWVRHYAHRGYCGLVAEPIEGNKR